MDANGAGSADRADATPPADRRRDSRLLVAVPATEARRLGEGGWVPVRATVLNVSGGGVLLTCDQPLQAGDYLVLVFAPEGGGVRLEVRVDVLRVEHIQAGALDLWRAGCTFQQPDPANREAIAHFIARLRPASGKRRSRRP